MSERKETKSNKQKEEEPEIVKQFEVHSKKQYIHDKKEKPLTSNFNHKNYRDSQVIL